MIPQLGPIRTTLIEHIGLINASNLQKAPVLNQLAKARGKLVLEGWSESSASTGFV